MGADNLVGRIRYGLSNLFGHLWSHLWNCSNYSYASRHQRLGIGSRTMAATHVGVVVGHSLPFSSLHLGHSVGYEIQLREDNPKNLSKRFSAIILRKRNGEKLWTGKKNTIES